MPISEHYDLGEWRSKSQQSQTNKQAAAREPLESVSSINKVESPDIYEFTPRRKFEASVIPMMLRPKDNHHAMRAAEFNQAVSSGALIGLVGLGTLASAGFAMIENWLLLCATLLATLLFGLVLAFSLAKIALRHETPE